MSALSTAIPGIIGAQLQPGLGGNIDRMRAEAAAHRSNVRTILIMLIEDLGSRWDNSSGPEPSAFYAPTANIVLGPNDVIEGRDAIRKAFTGRLKGIHGVQMRMEEFDTSGDVAFVRGTMVYDLLRPGAPGTKEIATFTMLLRTRRDDWLIQSHSISGIPALAGDPPADR